MPPRRGRLGGIPGRECADALLAENTEELFRIIVDFIEGIGNVSAEQLSARVTDAFSIEPAARQIGEIHGTLKSK